MQVRAAQAAPSDYIEDEAGVIGPETRAAASAILRELEQKTLAQVVVLTVKTTGGIPIEQYALERAEAWRLGRRGKDDGMLLVVAVLDRKYRFETGYGLEQILPDSLLGTIGRKTLVPAFRQGDYSGGVLAAVKDIAGIVAQAHGVRLSGIPEPTRPKKSGGLSPLGQFLAFLAIFLLLLMVQRSRLRGGLADTLIIGSMLGGLGRGGPGGFGSFGGGFGSFGGGGGGSFGGGGASGGW